MHYTTKTPVQEPIEIRISYANRIEVLTAYVTDSGTVNYSLTPANSSTPLSLSNLQAKGTYPRKAVPGWQSEVIDWVRTGLGRIVEIR